MAAAHTPRYELAMKPTCLLLATLLILIGPFATGVCSMKCGRNMLSPKYCSSIYNSVPVVTAEPYLTTAETKFGALIEAAAVDKSGSLFATDFFALTSTLGRISDLNNFVDQKVFYNGTSAAAAKNPFFNGLRFLPSWSGSRALAADVNEHSVILLLTDGAGRVSSSVFCHDSAMVQPNDIAIAHRTGRVYTSGQNWSSDTVIGDGDLWMCGGTPNFNVGSGGLPLKAVRLGVFGRTNGIEVSPDEKTLYLSEAFNQHGSVVSNKVWRFAIDPWTGHVWNQTIFVDFNELDGSGSVDVDGMRTDVDGNLFVARNGGGEVIKFSPQGQVLLRIELPSIQKPTNLELGGVNGTSLFVVGQCTAAQDDRLGAGCVDVWHGNSVPGRAFNDLNSYR